MYPHRRETYDRSSSTSSLAYVAPHRHKADNPLRTTTVNTAPGNPLTSLFGNSKYSRESRAQPSRSHRTVTKSVRPERQPSVPPPDRSQQEAKANWLTKSQTLGRRRSACRTANTSSVSKAPTPPASQPETQSSKSVGGSVETPSEQTTKTSDMDPPWMEYRRAEKENEKKLAAIRTQETLMGKDMERLEHQVGVPQGMSEKYETSAEDKMWAEEDKILTEIWDKEKKKQRQKTDKLRARTQTENMATCMSAEKAAALSIEFTKSHSHPRSHLSVKVCRVDPAREAATKTIHSKADKGSSQPDSENEKPVQCSKPSTSSSTKNHKATTDTEETKTKEVPNRLLHLPEFDIAKYTAERQRIEDKFPHTNPSTLMIAAMIYATFGESVFPSTNSTFLSQVTEADCARIQAQVDLMLAHHHPSLIECDRNSHRDRYMDFYRENAFPSSLKPNSPSKSGDSKDAKVSASTDGSKAQQDCKKDLQQKEEEKRERAEAKAKAKADEERRQKMAEEKAKRDEKQKKIAEIARREAEAEHCRWREQERRRQREKKRQEDCEAELQRERDEWMKAREQQIIEKRKRACEMRQRQLDEQAQEQQQWEEHVKEVGRELAARLNGPNNVAAPKDQKLAGDNHVSKPLPPSDLTDDQQNVCTKEPQQTNILHIDQADKCKTSLPAMDPGPVPVSSNPKVVGGSKADSISKFHRESAPSPELKSHESRSLSLSGATDSLTVSPKAQDMVTAAPKPLTEPLKTVPSDEETTSDGEMCDIDISSPEPEKEPEEDAESSFEIMPMPSKVEAEHNGTYRRWYRLFRH